MGTWYFALGRGQGGGCFPKKNLIKTHPGSNDRAIIKETKATCPLSVSRIRNADVLWDAVLCAEHPPPVEQGPAADVAEDGLGGILGQRSALLLGNVVGDNGCNCTDLLTAAPPLLHTCQGRLPTSKKKLGNCFKNFRALLLVGVK